MQSTKDDSEEALTLWQKLCVPYYLCQLIYFCVYLILEYTNNIGYASFFITAFTYGSAYLASDSIPSLSTANVKYLNQSKWTLFCLIIHVIATDLFMAYIWTKYDVIINSPLNVIQAYITLGNTVAGNINCCHELIHRSQFFSRVIGYVNLAVYQLTMYPIQHIYVHHKKVGSTDDPITAPKNYSLVKYYFRAIASSYKANFRYSKAFFTLMLLLQYSYVAILVIACKAQDLSLEESVKKVGFFIGFSYFSIFAFQIVQYIEHYGLIYRKSVQKNPLIVPECAWNATPNLLINLIGLRFQRHSDHHMNSYKSFNTLELNAKMPHFPFDFPVALTLCLIPPLWQKIMNPLVDKVLQGKQVAEGHTNFIKMCSHIVRIGFIGFVGIFNELVQYQFINQFQ